MNRYFVKVVRIVNWADDETVQDEYIQPPLIVSIRDGKKHWYIHTVDGRTIKLKYLPKALESMLPSEDE